VKRLLWLTLSLLLASASFAQDAAKKPKKPRVDISVFGGDFDLNEVEFDPDDLPGDVTLELERQRAGVRAAFGSENARGFVQVFSEEIEAVFSGSGEDFETFGVGGGVRGAPRVSEPDAALAFLIPYQADLALVYGNESEAGNDVTAAYIEFHAEVGFALEWQGLRPGVGVELSSLGGVVDADSGLFGGGADQTTDFTGTNAGAFAELSYKHPHFPLYVRARAGGGDFEHSELVIGASW
jgi:hypothetical protein